MCNFSALSLRSRILIGPIIALILTLIIFFKSYFLINDHAELLADLHETALPKLAETTRAMILLAQHNTGLHDLASHSKEELSEKELYIKKREFLLAQQEIEQYFSLWTHDSESYISEYAPREDIDYLMTQIVSTLGLYTGEVVAALNQADSEDGENKYLDNTSEVMKDLNNIFLTLSKLQTLKLKQRSRALEQAKKEQTMTTIISLALMLLMLLSTLFSAQQLSRIIGRINRSIIALANGEKNIKLPEAKSRDLQQITSALSVFQNVLEKESEQKQELASTVQELTLSQERYYNLLNISATAIITLDHNLDIVMFNRSAERIYGFNREEVIHKPVTLLIPEPERIKYQRVLIIFTKSKRDFNVFDEGVVCDALRKNGEVFPIEMRLGKTKDGDNMLVTLSMTDITERVRSEQEIRHQAHYDSLTGLPNRLLSLRRLQENMSEAEELDCMAGVMFLDLDDFKKINDSMGHEAGDLLLIEAAKRLRSVLVDNGSVGRLGGDEFIVLLSKLESVEKAKEIAKQLVLRFREPFDVDGRKLVLTSSIGVSLFPQDAQNSTALLRNADSAMYHSKKLGRNTFSLFTPDMREGVSRRLMLEEKMRGGLKHGEFSLSYQPKVDLRTNKVANVEALARWTSPELGKVRPDEFIPIAEQSGLIIELGQFVILESIKSIQNLAKAGFEMGVAINLSPRQFHDPNLVPFIKSSIEEAGINPELIELEITEGVLMSGHRFITEALQSLHNLGVKLAMDDFGTGFSSLSYLRKYSFDILKIDRSFISDLMVDEEDRELVNAMIAMAHSLGLEVVAEGVETIEQLEYLKKQGCEYAQGFLHGRPMTLEALVLSLDEDRNLLLSGSVA